jgi:hypothetical protein
MMFRRQVGHVFKKELAQLRRNPDALRILFIAPLLQMLAFGHAIAINRELSAVSDDLARLTAEWESATKAGEQQVSVV